MTSVNVCIHGKDRLKKKTNNYYNHELIIATMYYCLEIILNLKFFPGRYTKKPRGSTMGPGGTLSERNYLL